MPFHRPDTRAAAGDINIDRGISKMSFKKNDSNDNNDMSYKQP